MTLRHCLAVVGAVAFVALAGAPAHAGTAPSPFRMGIEATTAAGGVDYLISVRNTTDVPASLLVVERFATGPAALHASGEGKVNAGAAMWTLDVAAHDVNRVSSHAVYRGRAVTLSTVCLTDAATRQVIDCTAGDLPGTKQVVRKDSPVWTVVIGLFATGAVLFSLGYFGWRHRSRWWPATRRWAAERQSTLAVLAAGLAVVVIAAGAIVLFVSRAEPFLAEQAGTSKESIGWSGEAKAIQFGRPAISRQVEFTLYQWSCASGSCVAVVAARNLTNTEVPWLARMQRLKDAKGNWLQPDGELTVAANAGADPFATPLAAHERRLSSLVFKVATPAALTRLELREGAFAAGVSLALK